MVQSPTQYEEHVPQNDGHPRASQENDGRLKESREDNSRPRASREDDGHPRAYLKTTLARGSLGCPRAWIKGSTRTRRNGGRRSTTCTSNLGLPIFKGILQWIKSLVTSAREILRVHVLLIFVSTTPLFLLLSLLGYKKPCRIQTGCWPCRRS
jgi:hypothetical protein